MRRCLKRIFDFIATILVFPACLMSQIEKWFFSGSEIVFEFWAHVFSVVPGIAGLFLRRAYYWITLDSCARDFYIGFGALFTHREVVVEEGVYVGPYSLVGQSVLKSGTLIGSRVSIISGKYQHTLDENGKWTSCDLGNLTPIQIGPNAWIGEGAIVMADVGASTLVAAGAVVSSTVPDGIVVGGNPARFIKKIWPSQTG